MADRITNEERALIDAAVARGEVRQCPERTFSIMRTIGGSWGESGGKQVGVGIDPRFNPDTATWREKYTDHERRELLREMALAGASRQEIAQRTGYATGSVTSAVASLGLALIWERRRKK